MQRQLFLMNATLRVPPCVHAAIVLYAGRVVLAAFV
jgi:hypothetical protein